MSANPKKSAGVRFSNKPETQNFLPKKIKGPLARFSRIFEIALFLYTRGRTSIVFLLVLLSISFAPGVYLPVGTALAESSTSASYQLDYARFTSDSDEKTSSSYTLIDSISDISVEGASPSYNLRNIYPTGVSGPVCGNGLIETGEQCEGTNFNGLNCSNYGFSLGSLQCVSCQIVTTSCFNAGGGGGGGGGSDTFTCGNGKREAGEQCDDGNTLSGDGCSTGCRIEDHRCGNGIQEIGEQCDDGNANYDDGCTPLCTLEGPGVLPPDEEVEPEPEAEPETGPEPEEPIVFGPTFDPNLVFNFPKPVFEPKPEAGPEDQESEAPGLKPAAPEESSETDEIPSSVIEIRGIYDYHFENYQEGQIITILDETPFVVAEAKPNTIYEMIIFDEEGDIVTRQGVQSTPNGILMFEGIRFLEYKSYGIALFDKNRELYKSWTITIEDRKYRLHDNLYINDELNREYIALGSFEQIKDLSGNGKPNTKYHAYLQKIQKQSKKVSEITYISARSDMHGDYRLNLPEGLKNGAYLMHVVQVYEDGKVQRNKRYIFDVHTENRQSNIWVLLAILVIFLAGFPLRLKRRKRRLALSISLSIAIVLSIIMQHSTAIAAVTTPSVFIYEGKLLDSTNNPITSAQTFRFSFWNSDDFVVGDLTGAGGINPLAPAYGGWFETHTLTPNVDGTFFVELGSTTALPNMLLGTHTDLMVEIKASGAPDTSYELMDPSGDNGADTDDRQTVGSVPFTNNADFIDNAEIGTGAGDIATLGLGGLWNINYIPGGTNSDSWTIDVDDTVGAGSSIDLIFGTTLAEFLSFDITNDWFIFSNDVNFGQNELKNLAIDNLAAAPGTPVTGQIYHNTTDGNTYVWNGATWDDITAGATGVDDLDGVYGADADKKMAVNNASGLEFESTVTGDIVVDLQSTGDFVIQDAGTPFAIFTDGGSFGVGNTSPISIFHIDSNAINSTAIATLENTGGDIQFFRSDANPEGSIIGSIGDLAIDSTNGNAYIKNSGTVTSTGWLQLGGEEAKTAIFHAEYEDATIQGDGTSNKGLLSSYFADTGGTNKYNYYEWTTRSPAIQDVDIVISFRLPEDFQSFTSTPLSILYSTSNGVLATNQIDVALYDTTGTAVSLTGGTDLANAAWTTANLTFGGAPTFTAGDVITLVIKLQTTSAGYAHVSDVIFNYNGT